VRGFRIRNWSRRWKNRWSEAPRSVRLALTLLPSVAVAAACGWFLWTRVINDISAKTSFETLVLVDLPEMESAASADFNLSGDLVPRITRLEIGTWSYEPPADNRMLGLAFSRPNSGPPCSSLSLVPGRKTKKDPCSPQKDIQSPTLSIAPQGGEGCSVAIETEETMACTEQIPTIKKGQQLVITFEPRASNPPGFPELLFEHASVGGLTGRLADSLVLFDEIPQQRCDGTNLGMLAAGKIDIQSVRLDISKPTPVLDATFHLKALKDVRVDGRDCRYVVFRQLVRSSLLGHILTAFVSGTLAYIAGMRFFKRQAPKGKPP
jgi:hypothetical protein